MAWPRAAALLVVLGTCRGFLCPAAAPRPLRARPLAAADKQWLKDAMSTPSALTFPIHGVTVSPEGFRVLLTSPGRDRAAPLVVSSADTDRVQSPKVLTLMQLMSGIDMATPVFPVDVLDEAFGAKAEGRGHEWPSDGWALAEVRVAPSGGDSGGGGGDDSDTTNFRDLLSQDAGEPSKRVLADKAPKLLAALRPLLPGALDVEQVIDLLRSHGDADGNLSREGFSAILAALKNGGGAASQTKTERLATWTLVAAGTTGITADVDGFTAMACVARYKAPLVVQGALFSAGNGISIGADEVLSTFPSIRTVEELREEANERSAWMIEQWMDSRGDGGFA